jgi:hypothetical protein
MYKTGGSTFSHHDLPFLQYGLRAIPISLGATYSKLCLRTTNSDLTKSKIKSKHYPVLGNFHFINNDFGDIQNLKVK